MADRESSVALCYGVALKKKKIGRGLREQCRTVPRGGVKKRERSVANRESGVALCQGVALKTKKEREIGRGPRERCRSVPRGGVKNKKKREIGPGAVVADRERGVSLSLDSV